MAFNNHGNTCGKKHQLIIKQLSQLQNRDSDHAIPEGGGGGDGDLPAIDYSVVPAAIDDALLDIDNQTQSILLQCQPPQPQPQQLDVSSLISFPTNADSMGANRLANCSAGNVMWPAHPANPTMQVLFSSASLRYSSQMLLLTHTLSLVYCFLNNSI